MLEYSNDSISGNRDGKNSLMKDNGQKYYHNYYHENYIYRYDNHDNGDHCSHFPIRHHDNIHDNISHNNVYVIVIFMITIPV